MQFHLGFVYQSLLAILRYEGGQELSDIEIRIEGRAWFMDQTHPVRENNPKTRQTAPSQKNSNHILGGLD